MPVRSSISNARMVPSRLTPIRPLQRWSRAWMSVLKLSTRSATIFDRPAQQLRQRVGRHLVGIDVHLDAERAADILADHAHLRLLEAEMQGGDVLHHVRRLGALIDRSAAPRRRFQSATMARGSSVTPVWRPKTKFGFDHLVGLGECLIDGAGVEVALEGEIVAERGMDDRRRRIERGAHVRHRFQFLIVDRDQLRRRLRPARGWSPRSAATASPCQQARSIAIACCGADLRPFRCESTPTQGVMTAASSGAGHDRDDAGHALARRGVDPEDRACA